MKKARSRWLLSIGTGGERFYLYGVPMAWRVMIARDFTRRHIWRAQVFGYPEAEFRTLHKAKTWSLAIDRALRRIAKAATPKRSTPT